MVDKSGNRTASCVNYHLVVESHKIIALIVLVLDFHPSIALLLRDDLTCILNNDLMWIKTSHGTDAITTILRLNNLNTIVVPVALGTDLQFRKSAIGAKFWADETVGFITFIKHEAVLAILAATIFNIAKAIRVRFGL